MKDDSKDSIEVDAKTGKLAITGSSVSRISQSIADLISPFSEGFGLVGDHIRVYRENSVRHALLRAQTIAEERGQTISPVHPKNLVPMLEALSLEGDEEDELSDIWSRLLLSGDTKFDASLAMYTDSLKRLGRKEALLLKTLCTQCKHFPNSFPEDVRINGNSSLIRTIYLGRTSEMNEAEFDSFISSKFEGLNIYYCYALLVDEDIEDGKAFRHYINEYFDSFSSYLFLEREGLVAVKRLEIPYGKRLTSVLYVEATRLGLDFMKRCYPDEKGPQSE